MAERQMTSNQPKRQLSIKSKTPHGVQTVGVCYSYLELTNFFSYAKYTMSANTIQALYSISAYFY